MDLLTADYMLPTYVSSFANAWEELGEDAEVVETYSLTAVAGIKGEAEDENAMARLPIILTLILPQPR